MPTRLPRLHGKGTRFGTLSQICYLSLTDSFRNLTSYTRERCFSEEVEVSWLAPGVKLTQPSVNREVSTLGLPTSDWPAAMFVKDYHDG